jgi:hypothetical protein
MTKDHYAQEQRAMLRDVVEALDKTDLRLERAVIRFNGSRECAYRGYPEGGGEPVQGVILNPDPKRVPPRAQAPNP